MAIKLIVDTTLPPVQFQSQLIAAAKKARNQAKEIAAVRSQFERIGWNAQAAQELAEIHVRGVQQ